MVPPETMCKDHLLGEHRELHTFVGTLRKRISVSGYILLGELDPTKLLERHEELVNEMLRRGWSHWSPIAVPDFSYVAEKACIDVDRNLLDLRTRCSECKRLQELSCS